MKILYVGNFTDGTGWARAGTYNALCLDQAGHDVYCKEIKYINTSVCLDYRIIELKNKQSEQFDLVIHHVLPSEYVKYPNVKNVGVLELETPSLNNYLWIKNIRLMDEIWFPTYGLVKAYEKSIPNIKKFPHSTDIKKIKETHFKQIPELSNSYNFIFVGENNTRKNIEGLINAFYSEFDYYEDVNLVIKTNKGLDLNSIWNKTRKTLGRRKNIFLIDKYEEEAAIYNLMKNCHCFVMPSRGEAWCYPAMEACALGLRVIYTNGIGIEEYCRNGLKINSQIEQCYGVEDAVSDLYTCNDVWCEPDIRSLRSHMRQVYTDFKECKNFPTDDIHVDYYDFRDTRKLEGLL